VLDIHAANLALEYSAGDEGSSLRRRGVGIFVRFFSQSTRPITVSGMSGPRDQHQRITHIEAIGVKSFTASYNGFNRPSA